ncbi:MAG: LysR substrate-binding domain-containing protein [Noviherbaspirillum sp.]
MDLRALRYFVETVRHRSFTQAAAVLFVTQSTVSKMVRQLEEEVGQPLLIREGRTVRLTDVGQAVFARAEEALGVIQRLRRDVADLAELARGELELGLPPMVNLLFAPIIKRFRERWPHVELKLAEAGGQVIEQRILSGELEVGVTVLPTGPDARLATRELGRFPICLVGAASAPWAHLEQPGLDILHRQPVLMFSEDYSLTRLLRSAFEAGGVQPEVVARSGQWDFLLSMAVAGVGTALLPQPLLQQLRLPEGVAVRPVTAPGLAWTVGVVWVKDRYLSHAARAWLAACGES